MKGKTKGGYRKTFYQETRYHPHVFVDPLPILVHRNLKDTWLGVRAVTKLDYGVFFER